MRNMKLCGWDALLQHWPPVVCHVPTMPKCSPRVSETRGVRCVHLPGAIINTLHGSEACSPFLPYPSRKERAALVFN